MELRSTILVTSKESLETRWYVCVVLLMSFFVLRLNSQFSRFSCLGSLKVPLWQKINYDFSLEIKTMLAKLRWPRRLTVQLWFFTVLLLCFTVQLWFFTVQLWFFTVQLWFFTVQLWFFTVPLWFFTVHLWFLKQFSCHVCNSSVGNFHSSVVIFETVQLWFFGWTKETGTYIRELRQASVFLPPFWKAAKLSSSLYLML